MKGEKESRSPKVLSQSSSKESLHSVAGSVAESRTGFVTSDVSNASSGNHRRVRAKLPKLELSKFNGKVVEWQEFWAGFKSVIHDDNELAKVDNQVSQEFSERASKECSSRIAPNSSRL